MLWVCCTYITSCHLHILLLCKHLIQWCQELHLNPLVHLVVQTQSSCWGNFNSSTANLLWKSIWSWRGHSMRGGGGELGLTRSPADGWIAFPTSQEDGDSSCRKPFLTHTTTEVIARLYWWQQDCCILYKSLMSDRET